MKKFIFTLIFVFLLVLPLEIVSRTYWKIKSQLSFWTPEAMDLFGFTNLHQTKITQNDGYYDILFLGGSVLYFVGNWKGTVPLLQKKLQGKTNLPIRIHNLATPSHSSRDSMFKYRFLADKHFDLVVIYDSINEVRANNCPPEIFRKDYSHYSWYKKLNFFEYYYPFFKFFTLPYTIYSLTIDVQEKIGARRFVPTNQPEADWIQYGKAIKTAASFENNLNTILDLAKKRQEPVLMSTFAFYVPKNYSYFRFQTHQLDYDKHTFPIEIWGKPEYVILGTLAHNNIMHKLAANHPEIMFLDEYPRMPKGKEYFNDICHLTDKGIEKLVDDFGNRLMQDNKN